MTMKRREFLPADRRVTYVAAGGRGGGGAAAAGGAPQLLPAGLIGPVRVIVEVKAAAV